MLSKAMIAKKRDSNPKEDQKNQYPAYAFKSDDSQNKRFQILRKTKKNQYPAYAFKSDDSQNKRFKS